MDDIIDYFLENDNAKVEKFINTYKEFIVKDDDECDYIFINMKNVDCDTSCMATIKWCVSYMEGCDNTKCKWKRLSYNTSSPFALWLSNFDDDDDSDNE